MQQQSGQSIPSKTENLSERLSSAPSVVPEFSSHSTATAKLVDAAATPSLVSNFHSKSTVLPIGTSSSASNRLITRRCQPLNDLRSRWAMT